MASGFLSRHPENRRRTLDTPPEAGVVDELAVRVRSPQGDVIEGD
jgi:hypothetical protein